MNVERWTSSPGPQRRPRSPQHQEGHRQLGRYPQRRHAVVPFRHHFGAAGPPRARECSTQRSPGRAVFPLVPRSAAPCRATKHPCADGVRNTRSCSSRSSYLQTVSRNEPPQPASGDSPNRGHQLGARYKLEARRFLLIATLDETHSGSRSPACRRSRTRRNARHHRCDRVAAATRSPRVPGRVACGP